MLPVWYQVLFFLTCVILAVLADPAPSDVIAVGEGVHGGIVHAGGGVAVAAAGLAGEGVPRGPVPPGLVAVGGEAGLAVGPHRVVLALADGVNLVATPTRMAIAGTPVSEKNGVIFKLNHPHLSEKPFQRDSPPYTIS